MPKLSPNELSALLQAEKQDCLGLFTSELANERSQALDFYYGNMDAAMPHAVGRSGAVSTDVADVIEGLMPGLMDVFCSTDEPVMFNPVGPEDEGAARQETDYVNHVFMQENPGFLTLYSFIKDALLSKVGIVKVMWEKTQRIEQETYLNQTQDALAILLTEPDVEIIEKTERQDPTTGETLYDVTLLTKKDFGQAKVYPVPPEEFGINKRARTLRDATYCFHQPRGISESDLIRQGYDETQVRALPSYSDVGHQEELSRDTVEVGLRGTVQADLYNTAMRPVHVVEHYVRMDYDGNGPRLYKILTGGDVFTILRKNGEEDVQPFDVMPFACMTPFPVTHRFFGRSIADLVMDIQKIKTSLYRSLLDNAYLANNQRIEVSESHMNDATLDDLLVSRPGGVVRTRMPGGLNPIQNNPIGNFVFPLIEYVDSTREARTGLSLRAAGLDANALQNQTATAVNVAFTAVQAKMKLIARIFAETGIRDLFSLLHATIRKNETKANTVRLRGTWVMVDPRDWRHRDDMTIMVGLGTGTKEQQMGHLIALMNIQKEHAMAGLPTVTPQNLYNSAAKAAQLAGFNSADPYFTDPASPQGQQMAAMKQQHPDPKAMEAQQKIQIANAEAQAKMQREQYQVQAQVAAENQRFQHEATLEQQKNAMDMQLAQQKHDMAMEEARQRLLHNEVTHRQAQGGAMLPEHAAEMMHNALEQINQHLSAHQQTVANMLNEHSARLRGSLMAKKRVIRDHNNRIVGTETIQ